MALHWPLQGYNLAWSLQELGSQNFFCHHSSHWHMKEDIISWYKIKRYQLLLCVVLYFPPSFETVNGKKENSFKEKSLRKIINVLPFLNFWSSCIWLGIKYEVTNPLSVSHFTFCCSLVLRDGKKLPVTPWFKAPDLGLCVYKLFMFGFCTTLALF